MMEMLISTYTDKLCYEMNLVTRCNVTRYGRKLEKKLQKKTLCTLVMKEIAMGRKMTITSNEQSSAARVNSNTGIAS